MWSSQICYVQQEKDTSKNVNVKGEAQMHLVFDVNIFWSTFFPVEYHIFPVEFSHSQDIHTKNQVNNVTLFFDVNNLWRAFVLVGRHKCIIPLEKGVI